jgi:uncharacterized protein YdhG (YjbR/CyaY superfamily)
VIAAKPESDQEVSMSPKKGAKKSKKKASADRAAKKSAGSKASGGWTADERAAMKERAREMKAEARRGKSKADGESDLLAKVAEMKGSDRTMAKRLHAIVRETAPDLSPKTWYGMPAYANEDGKVVCYFTPAGKFKSRYATLGFNDDASLDEGAMWPTSFAVLEMTADVEKRIAALVKKAVS